MSQVTLQSLDLATQADNKGSETGANTDVKGQEHEFSQMFQRQVNAEEKGNSTSRSETYNTSSKEGASAKNKSSESNKAENSQHKNEIEQDGNTSQKSDLGISTSDADQDEAAAEKEQIQNENARIKDNIQNKTTENTLEDAKQASAKSITEDSIDFLNLLSNSEKLLTDKKALSSEEANKEVNHKNNPDHLAKSELSQHIHAALNLPETSSDDANVSTTVSENIDTNTGAVSKISEQNVKDATMKEPQVLVSAEQSAKLSKNEKPLDNNDLEVEGKNNLETKNGQVTKLQPDVIQTATDATLLKAGQVAEDSESEASDLAAKKATQESLKQASSAQENNMNGKPLMNEKKDELTHLANHKALDKNIDKDALKINELMSSESHTNVIAEDEFAAEQSAKVLAPSDKELNKTVTSQKSSAESLTKASLNQEHKTVVLNEAVKQDNLREAQVITDNNDKVIGENQVIDQRTLNHTLGKGNDTAQQSPSKEVSGIKTQYGESPSVLTQSDSTPKGASTESTEVMLNKPENSLFNSIKTSQESGLFRDVTSNTYGISQSESVQNPAQIDALTNKYIADNVQQVKNNQIQQNETINIHRKDFAESIKDKVMVLVNQKLQQVDIKLDPPELGNVHVRVNLQGEAATVNFVVQNPQAKEALEQHMGKLRDMLNESGVDVGEANVQQQQKNQDENGEYGNEQGGSGNNSDDGQNLADDNVISSTLVKASSTGVDFYA